MDGHTYFGPEVLDSIRDDMLRYFAVGIRSKASTVLTVFIHGKGVNQIVSDMCCYQCPCLPHVTGHLNPFLTNPDLKKEEKTIIKI